MFKYSFIRFARRFRLFLRYQWNGSFSFAFVFFFILFFGCFPTNGIHKFCYFEVHRKTEAFHFSAIFFSSVGSWSLFGFPRIAQVEDYEQSNILQTNQFFFLLNWKRAWARVVEKCVQCGFEWFDWDAGCVFFYIMIISCRERLIRLYLLRRFSPSFRHVCECVYIFVSVLKVTQLCYPSIDPISNPHINPPCRVMDGVSTARMKHIYIRADIIQCKNRFDSIELLSWRQCLSTKNWHLERFGLRLILYIQLIVWKSHLTRTS